MAVMIPDNCSRVLEIGCSNGTFSRHFPLNIEYWGIDPALKHGDVVVQSKKKLFDKPIEDTVIDLPSHYFDLIVANDVLEHLQNPDEVLLRLKASMAPQGIFIGSVPNVRYCGLLWELIVRGEWRYRDQGVLDRTHLRFFTKRSLMRMLVESGYEVTNLQGINSDLSRGGVMRRVALAIIIFASLGWFKDIQYAQIAFSVKV